MSSPVALFGRRPGYHRQRWACFDGTPARVHVSRDIDGPDLRDCALHVGDAVDGDPIIDAERAFGGIRLPGLERRWWRFPPCLAARLARRCAMHRPQAFPAHAVVEPALHGAAAARSFVVLARPFVVAPRQRIEHPRTDARDRTRCMAGRRAQHGLVEEQIVDHGAKTGPGAGALLPLIQNQTVLVGVGGQIFLDAIGIGKDRRRREQTGLINAVSEIWPISRASRSLPSLLRTDGMVEYPSSGEACMQSVRMNGLGPLLAISGNAPACRHGRRKRAPVASSAMLRMAAACAQHKKKPRCESGDV